MQAPGVYTDVEELLKCRQWTQGLVLAARKDSRAITNGSVKTRYRGRGMEFAEVRPYQAGDDIRTIDWRVTARVQSPYTKLFQEEHERPVFLLVDQRAPMFFGSREQFKSVFAAKLAATIGWIGQANNDRVGALVFGDTKQHDIRPRRGKHAVLELINQLVAFNQALQSPVATAHGNSLTDMCKDTARVAKPGALVILISDFHDFTDACREPLTLLAKRSDLLAIHVYDPLEQQLPKSGLLGISDRHQQITIDVRKLGHSFAAAFEQHAQALRNALQQCGIQYAQAPLTQNSEDFVRDLFHRRHGALQRRRG